MISMTHVKEHWENVGNAGKGKPSPRMNDLTTQIVKLNLVEIPVVIGYKELYILPGYWG